MTRKGRECAGGMPTAPLGRLAGAAGVICASVVLWVCCGWQAQAAAPESGASVTLNLTLSDAVRLALRNNRRLIDARLERVVDRFTLRVAENRLRPRVSVGPYTKWSRAETSDGEWGVASEVGVRVYGDDARPHRRRVRGSS